MDTVEVISEGTSKTMERTSALRWVRDPLAGFPPRDKLQQGWFCRETGEVEWRDIEIVYG